MSVVTVQPFMHSYSDENGTVVSTQKSSSPMPTFVPAKIMHKAELLLSVHHKSRRLPAASGSLDTRLNPVPQLLCKILSSPFSCPW